MDKEYPQSFACAFCQDRYCIALGQGRRTSFIGMLSVENTNQPINACPKFRICMDYIKGEIPDIPQEVRPVNYPL